MNNSSESLRFPLWKFLNQPILDKTCPLILRPSIYWKLYQLEHLDRCWNVAYPSESESHNT